MKHTAILPISLFAACVQQSAWLPPVEDVPGTARTYAGVPGEPGNAINAVTPEHRRSSRLGFPIDISFSPDRRAWIVDWNNHMLRRVEADDTLAVVVGNENEGDGSCFHDGCAALALGAQPGVPGPELMMNHPTDVTFFRNGDALISAWHNNKLRIWEATTGKVRTLAGRDDGYRGDGGPAHLAELNLPKGAAIGSDGRIYVVDARNQRIRAIAQDDDRTITNVLGTGTPGAAGDGGPADRAQIYLDRTGMWPEGAVTVSRDYLYIADTSNNRIRRMSLATTTVETIAGTGAANGDGDGGPAIDASLSRPFDIELGPDGRLYIADTGNNVIRAIDLETGIIERVAGTAEPCSDLFRPCLEAEEGLPADQIRLHRPSGIDFDCEGNLYIADQFNNRVVRIARDWDEGAGVRPDCDLQIGPDGPI